MKWNLTSHLFTYLLVAIPTTYIRIFQIKLFSQQHLLGYIYLKKFDWKLHCLQEELSSWDGILYQIQFTCLSLSHDLPAPVVNKVVIQEKKTEAELLQGTTYLIDWEGSRTNIDTAETPNISLEDLLL